MKQIILLLMILILNIVSRFWQIDKIPPLIDSSFLSLRYLSALLSIDSVFLVYFYAKKVFKNDKIAILSSWTMTLLPWTIEQGRIYSQVNNALFILLLFLIFLKKMDRNYLKILFFVFCSLFFVLVYPDFWLFRSDSVVSAKVGYFNNFFILISPSLLFFKNITFWWGGVRDFGIMHLSFLPFFVVGFYQLIKLRKYFIIALLSTILFTSSASPFLPEDRDFFLTSPFISMIVALGMHRLFISFISGESPLSEATSRWLKQKLLALLIFLFIVYDLAQFLHYYTIHYPQQILTNSQQIKEPF